VLGRTSLSRTAATSFTPDPDRESFTPDPDHESFTPGRNRELCNKIPPLLRLASEGRSPKREIVLLLLNNQHQHCTWHIQTEVLPHAWR